MKFTVTQTRQIEVEAEDEFNAIYEAKQEWDLSWQETAIYAEPVRSST